MNPTELAKHLYFLNLCIFAQYLQGARLIV
jgi:hypothetical protein